MRGSLPRRWLRVLTFAACVAILGVDAADAQIPSWIHFGIAVGASHPVNEQYFRYATACDWTALVEFRPASSPLALRLESNFSGYSSIETPVRVSSAKREILEVGGSFVLHAQSTTWQPYVLAGGGLYDVKVWAHRYGAFAGRPYTAFEDRRVPGWSAGIGVSLPIGSGPRAPRAFLEMRSTYVKTRDSDQSDRGLNFVKLMAGTTF